MLIPRDRHAYRLSIRNSHTRRHCTTAINVCDQVLIDAQAAKNVPDDELPCRDPLLLAPTYASNHLSPYLQADTHPR